MAHGRLDTMSEQGHTQYAPFAYLAAQKVTAYRHVMLTFIAAKEQFAVHLRPDDVAARMTGDDAPDADELAAILDQLSSPTWGNLLAFPDTSRVLTLEDFQRRRMIYQLSPAGEAAERALGVYDRTFGERGELQSVALQDIAAQLVALATAMRADAPDVPLIHNGLRSLTSVFADLAENATAFMGSLQRSIDLQDADLDAFIAYKDRLIGYIDRFISDLAVRGQRIAQELTGFSIEDVQRMCTLVAARELEDRPPDDTADPQQEQSAAADRWHLKWQGLVNWFVSTPTRKSEADLLRARARSAVPQLLQIVAILVERQSGRTDRSTDFLALAEWFAQLPDDASRHRLWRSAFGLTPARHLSVPTDTTAEWKATGIKPGLAWSDAPPIAVSPRLRTTGQWERRGPGARIKDRTEAKRLLAELAREAKAIADADRRRLAARTPARLSELGSLDEGEFRLLLMVLGDASGTLGDSAQAHAVSSDGGLTIDIKRPGDGARAVVTSPAGTLTGPDYAIELEAA